jgi:hypothetical protein
MEFPGGIGRALCMQDMHTIQGEIFGVFPEIVCAAEAVAKRGAVPILAADVR